MTAESRVRTKTNDNPASHKKRSDKYYQQNKERVLEQTRIRQQRGRALIHSLKEGKSCIDCGQTFDPVAMDWHHLNGEDKIIGVSQMRGHSEAKILAEVAKCVLICSNCHRVRHFKK